MNNKNNNKNKDKITTLQELKKEDAKYKKVQKTTEFDNYLNHTDSGILIQRAQKIFPYMTHINNDYTNSLYNDIYDENFLELTADEDLLNPTEQGFMLGYLEA